MEIRVGTSGWHYPHWRGAFYPVNLPTQRWLSYYAQHFDTVELNNSFYRLPPESAVQSWCQQTPKSFLFAVKASRYITHSLRLANPNPGLDRFFKRIVNLGPRLGPILFQLPPRWRPDPERLASFLHVLAAGHRYAFEFRDERWQQPEIYALLRKHGAALCIFHLAGYQSPIQLTADFAYIRLHGPTEIKYAGKYTRHQLATWAHRIASWRGQIRAVYVYFDNDQGGFAAENAARLRIMLQARQL